MRQLLTKLRCSAAWNDQSPLNAEPLKSHLAELEKVIKDELQFIAAARVFQKLAESITDEDDEDMGVDAAS